MYYSQHWYLILCCLCKALNFSISLPFRVEEHCRNAYSTTDCVSYSGTTLYYNSAEFHYFYSTNTRFTPDITAFLFKSGPQLKFSEHIKVKPQRTSNLASVDDNHVRDSDASNISREWTGFFRVIYIYSVFKQITLLHLNVIALRWRIIFTNLYYQFLWRSSNIAPFFVDCHIGDWQR